MKAQKESQDLQEIQTQKTIKKPSIPPPTTIKQEHSPDKTETTKDKPEILKPEVFAQENSRTINKPIPNSKMSSVDKITENIVTSSETKENLPETQKEVSKDDSVEKESINNEKTSEDKKNFDAELNQKSLFFKGKYECDVCKEENYKRYLNTEKGLRIHKLVMHT
ncbi:hypothetical protein MHBO_000825 [Bonamia ostreae]|uniref:C2H2-type domain-containing protein n=1 Tax=Bonamia ostreae TaxID=126728 RepID=A0ABV2AHT5_9EUKA